MYLQTSRLQYTLQETEVFQTVHSNKKIQATACCLIVSLLPEKCNRKLLYDLNRVLRPLAIVNKSVNCSAKPFGIQG